MKVSCLSEAFQQYLNFIILHHWIITLTRKTTSQ